MDFLSADLEKIEEAESKIGRRENIPLEKGVVLTDSYLEEHRELFEKYCNYFSVYPDVFLDLIKPENEEISLFFYQRLILCALMRLRKIIKTVR